MTVTVSRPVSRRVDVVPSHTAQIVGPVDVAQTHSPFAREVSYKFWNEIAQNHPPPSKSKTISILESV